MPTRLPLAAALAAVTLPLAAPAPAVAAPSATAPTRPAAAPRVPAVPIGRASTPSRGLGFWCTAGLPATKNGRTYLLTAGHCARMGETMYSGWSRGRRSTIGRVTGTSNRLDVAVIRTTRRPAPVRGIATVKPGQQVCQYGVRSRRVCGITVVANTRDPHGLRTVYGRVPAGRVAARGGDSGGLVVDARGRAVGIVSAVSRDGRWVAWTPARTALATWGLTPLTR